jgi:hypothetical protein
MESGDYLMTTMVLYTGDLVPTLEITVSGDDPVDLTAATSVLIIGTSNNGRTVVFSRSPTTIQAVGDTSVLTMDWQVGDTAIARTIQLEVEAIWPINQPQTFRVSDCVIVLNDFGGAA